MQRLLELSDHRHGLLAGLAKLALRLGGDSGTTGQRLHRLQVLQPLFAPFAGPERLVLPRWEEKYVLVVVLAVLLSLDEFEYGGHANRSCSWKNGVINSVISAINIFLSNKINLPLVDN